MQTVTDHKQGLASDTSPTEENGKIQGRILVVDDEPNMRRILRRVLEGKGHQVLEAGDGKEGIGQLDDSLDLILLDLQMPNLDGLTFLRNLRESDTSFADTPVIAVTGLDTPENRKKAFGAGANDLIGKPFEPLELELRTTAQIRSKRSTDRLKRERDALGSGPSQWEGFLPEPPEEDGSGVLDTAGMPLKAIQALVTVGEFRDGRGPTHVLRMARMCTLTGETVHLPHDQLELIGPAASLHDIGMIGIPEAVPLKRGPLTLEERAIMERHTYIGSQILKSTTGHLFRLAALVALTHHERWDGTGYPLGLSGMDIPLAGRICAVADVFDALTTPRPFRQARSNEEAFDYLKRTRGKDLDPVVVDAFLELRPQIEEIQAEFPEKPRHWSSAGIMGLQRSPVARGRS